jgi:hypothetical protein
VVRDSCAIARSPWAVDGYFEGMQDEIHLFNRILSPAWLKCAYENQKPDSKLVSLEAIE